jgi:hypothetical protein
MAEKKDDSSMKCDLCGKLFYQLFTLHRKQYCESCWGVMKSSDEEGD